MTTSADAQNGLHRFRAPVHATELGEPAMANAVSTTETWITIAVASGSGTASGEHRTCISSQIRRRVSSSAARLSAATRSSRIDISTKTL